MKGHDILLGRGGLGIAPLRSLINNIHDERSEFGKVTIIYGSRNRAKSCSATSSRCGATVTTSIFT